MHLDLKTNGLEICDFCYICLGVNGINNLLKISLLKRSIDILYDLYETLKLNLQWPNYLVGRYLEI
jgi:hypothetical protein